MFNLLPFRKNKNNGSSNGHNGNGHDHVNGNDENDIITLHERTLLNNILKLRDIRVVDMMIPRADIIAADIHTPWDELVHIVSQANISRLPIFHENLDNILGTVHIKDLFGYRPDEGPMDLGGYLTDIPIVSPAMPVLDLILEMRQNKRHMVLVVDEHGGIDGLVTLADLIETIVGEIDDEHDNEDDEPQMYLDEDNSLIADGRIHIDHFEQEFGELLKKSEREECDTLGGLVFTIAGRVPAHGEILKHSSGMEFEILDGDSRRINKIRIRNIPQREDPTP